MLKKMRRVLIMMSVVLVAYLGMTADTNVISFAYTTSVTADASAPDPWLRNLNDGYWTNGVSDAVKYADDVTVTIDLGRRMQLTQVDLFTYSETGAETLATESAVLECSQDQTTWMGLGVLTAQGDGHFAGSSFWANARYLRVTCAKAAGADGQLIAEIVVSSSSANPRALLPFSYVTSIPAHPNHSDNSLSLLKDGKWSKADTESVQYGVSSAAAVDPLNPTNCIASNVVITVTLTGIKTLRSGHLYAYNGPVVSYGTERVVLSNSLDGVNWTCLGEQTLYVSLVDNYNPSTEVSRFDFILPNVESRYLAFACKKKEGANVLRQLLGEVQVLTSTAKPVLGEPLAYTYELNKPVSSSADRADCPKLTDRVWDHVVNNALRFYDDVEITADLGAPMYVAGTDLLCWSNEFSAGGTYYGTGRIVVHGSLDKSNWTELAEITDHIDPYSPYEYAVTFTNLPYVRYLRLDTYRCDGTALGQDFTAQIMGELFIYRPPTALLGAAPVAVANAITFAGFETDPLLPAGGLVQGGTTNGWTFSYTDANNYSGWQRNNSVVSTNNFKTYIYAPEGEQTAVMKGASTMTTQITVPDDGQYLLQYQMNASSYLFGSNPYYNGGYAFRIKLDGVEVAQESVKQLIYVTRQALLRNLTAGTHTLQFEGGNTPVLTYQGILIDDIQLLRYELPADQVTTQGADFTLVADSRTPLSLSYDGEIQVAYLWVEGEHLPQGRYSAAVSPAVFDGPGYIGFNPGTIIIVK